MDTASRASRDSQLSTFQSVVVAFFETPDSVEVARAELLALGLPTDDIHVVGGATSTAAAGTPAATPGQLPRLIAAVSGAFWRRPPAAVIAAPAAESVMIVQAVHLPSETIAEVCRHCGARQIDSRGAVHAERHV